ADLRQRAIRHGDENNLSERDRLIDRACLSEGTKARDQVLQLLGMARREQHRMPRLDPQPSDRATDTAGADDANAQFVAAVRLGQQAPRPQRRAEDQRAARTEHCSAVAVDSVMVGHQKLLALTRFRVWIEVIATVW